MNSKQVKKEELLRRKKSQSIWVKYMIRCVKKDYDLMNIDIYNHLVKNNQIQNPLKFKHPRNLYVNIDGTIWYFNPYFQDFIYAGRLL